jgi:nucleoside 2-deoxyribosyltransferase
MPKKPTCFIIMPISTPAELVKDYGGDKEHFTHVLEALFIPAVKMAEFDAIRPITEGAAVIQANIIRNLEEADLVLCDISSLNPNVFFELGIRTALNKPVSLVRDHVTKGVPFDTGVVNHHEYLATLHAWELERERENLARHIRQSAEGGENVNALWSYFGLSARAQRAEEGGKEKDRLDFLLLQTEALRKELASLITRLPVLAMVSPPAGLDQRNGIRQKGLGPWFEVSGMIAGREGWISCRSCDWSQSFEPALGDKPPTQCPKCGAS